MFYSITNATPGTKTLKKPPLRNGQKISGNVFPTNAVVQNPGQGIRFKQKNWRLNNDRITLQTIPKKLIPKECRTKCLNTLTTYPNMVIPNSKEYETSER